MSFNVFWSHERICFNFSALSYETDNGDHLIDFTSRSLTKAKKIYNQIKKEMLPLMLGMTRFHKYLLGWTYKKDFLHLFLLLMNRCTLVNLLIQNKQVAIVVTAQIQCWALTLSAYSNTIKYHKDIIHANVDACSQLPLNAKLADPQVLVDAMLMIKQLDDSPVTRHQIACEIKKNPWLMQAKILFYGGFS